MNITNMKHIFLISTLQAYLCTSIFISSPAYGMENSTQPVAATIEPFNKERDLTAVREILAKDAQYLTYESQGSPAGTTESYLLSSKYKTDVIRVNDQTVGFVNYAPLEAYLLTFYIGKTGLVHLMGVNDAYRKQGLGTKLLQHAVQELEKSNVPTITISVAKNNVTARNMYKKAGFEPDQATKAFEALPEGTRAQLPQFYLKALNEIPVMYEKKYNIPADLLPQGNIIQRHPKKSALIAAVAVGAIIAFKKS